MSEVEQKIGYKDILKQKNYMKNVIAALINRFGDSIDSIAFTWLVYQVTQSAAWSAIIFGVNRIPTIFLQPFAGAAIEGKNKKRVMIITDMIRGLCVMLIATSMLMGFTSRWLLLAMTIVISTAEAFRGPASTAMLPKILEKQYYEFGLSLSSSASSIMELVGLGLAGVIIASFGISTAIYIDAATFFLSACIILTMHVKEEKQQKANVNIGAYIENLREGMAYIGDKKFIKYFVLLAVFLNAILVPFNSLQAPLVKEILHTSEYMLSVLGVAISIGMIIGSTIYPYVNTKISKHVLVSLGGYSICIYYFILILAGRFSNSPIILNLMVAVGSVLMGGFVSLMMTFANVEFMKSVEENYLARVGALFNSACVAAIPIVSFLVTILAKFCSTRVLFIVAGVCGILVCLNLCSRKKTNLL